MTFEWEEVSVGDVSTLVTKGTTPTTVGYNFQDQGVRFVKVETLAEDGHFIEDKFAYISDEANKALLRSQLKEDDVLFTIAGTIGRTGIVRSKYLPANINQAVAIVRPNKSKIEPTFLRYVLTNPVFTRKAKSKTVQSVQENFSLGELKQVKFNLPSLTEQQSISKVLGTIDDRIALLRDTNLTLESISKAMFKSWFIDFDPVRAKQEGKDPEGVDERIASLFPNNFIDSEIGKIPSHWNVVNINDICEIIINGGTPSRSNQLFWEGGDIPWYKTGELTDTFLINHAENITQLGLDNSSVKTLPAYSVLMAIYAAPTVGRLGILIEPSAFNQAATGMKAKKEIGYIFLYLTLLFGRSWFNNRANGAAQQNISKGIVESYKFVVPDQIILNEFNSIVEPIFQKIEFNVKKILALTNLRDTLLPRLISGKLRLTKEGVLE
jgi:type I restriction enzyme, S subunit